MITAQAAFSEALRYLAAQPTPGTLHELQRAVLRKAERTLENDGHFSILDFPLAIHASLGGDPEVGRVLAAAALLFYAAADVTDDAEDHDLAADPWEAWGWEQATNTGIALLFQTLQYLQDSLAIAAAPAIVAAFVRAGVEMAKGQHLDLLGQAMPMPTFQAYVTSVEGKTGASFGAYAEAVAIANGRRDADDFRAFGRKLGTMLQMVSDIYELWRAPESSDLANGRLSLPIVLGLEQLRGELREQLIALLADSTLPHRQARLVALFEDTGLRGYAALRIEVYRRQARELAEQLGLVEHPYLLRLLEYPAFPSSAVPL